jgi:methylated-DNA-[protein]-cysteine S-methyltransferase
MSVSPGWTICDSPIEPLTVVAGPGGITNIHFTGHVPRLSDAGRQPMPEVTSQLDAYFAGERQAFELDLDLRGNPLQRAVWEQLLEIPYGETTTYGQMAKRIGEALYDPELEPYRRPRVIGAAIGRNPVAVVVPCHRVIGADGSLTGYFGGVERKRVLLELEGAGSAREAPGSASPADQLAML